MDIKSAEIIPFPEGEFVPLPYFNYDVRPSHVPIHVDEAATALFLSDGVIADAARRLRVHPLRLQRVIGKFPRLQRLHAELASLLNDKVHQEYLRAFGADDDRRREWAASKVAAARQFQVHPLAPAVQAGSALTVVGPSRIVISWETDLPVIGVDGGSDGE